MYLSVQPVVKQAALERLKLAIAQERALMQLKTLQELEALTQYDKYPERTEQTKE